MMKLSSNELNNIKRLLLSKDSSNVTLGYELAKEASAYHNELQYELVIVAMLSKDKPLRNKFRHYLEQHFSPEQFKLWELAFEVFYKFDQYYYPEAEQTLERHEAIRKDFEPSFRQSAHFAEHYYKLASTLQYTLKERPLLAKDYYNIVIAANPQHTDALFNLGHLYQIFFHDNVNSEICYKKVIELQPTDAIVYNNLGALYKNNARLDEAIEHIKKALKHKPNDTLYTLNLADAYKKSNDLLEFERLLKEVLSRDKSNKRVLNVWATYLWIDKKDYAAAKKVYEQGIHYHPNDKFLVGNLGELYETVYKDYHKAFEYYQHLLNTHSPPYHLILIVSLLVNHLKDLTKAQEYYEVLQNKKTYQTQPRDSDLNDQQWSDFLAAEKILVGLKN
ncbi:MAG: tetratricopeptide repeat protein [Aureispira sp.]|nr:tetratricopeptide repeat protein [Aureispira sp.]